MRRVFVLVCFVSALTACGRQRVATQPDLPPLAPPPPPERVVAPPDTSQEPPAPAPEPEQKAPRRAAPRNQGARETAPKTEPAKPVPPVVAPPAGPPAQQQPATTLQTTSPATTLEMDRTARGLLAQAKNDLGRVKPGTLNADGRGQFEAARRFIEQADQALKEQNFVLALRLADKAATIAAVLVGR